MAKQNMKVGDVSARLGQKKLKQYMTRLRVLSERKE